MKTSRAATFTAGMGLAAGLLLMGPLNSRFKHLRWVVGGPVAATSAVALVTLRLTRSTPSEPEEMPAPLSSAQLERQRLMDESRALQRLNDVHSVANFCQHQGLGTLLYCFLSGFEEELDFLVELDNWCNSLKYSSAPGTGPECLTCKEERITAIAPLPARVDPNLIRTFLQKKLGDAFTVEIEAEEGPHFHEGWEGRFDYLLFDGFEAERETLAKAIEWVQTVREKGSSHWANHVQEDPIGPFRLVHAKGPYAIEEGPCLLISSDLFPAGTGDNKQRIDLTDLLFVLAREVHPFYELGDHSSRSQNLDGILVHMDRIHPVLQPDPIGTTYGYTSYGRETRTLASHTLYLMEEHGRDITEPGPLRDLIIERDPKLAERVGLIQTSKQPPPQRLSRGIRFMNPPPNKANEAYWQSLGPGCSLQEYE